MTFSAHGIDGFLLVVAVLAFLAAAIVAWVAPGHKVWATLVAAGLLFWALTDLVH